MISFFLGPICLGSMPASLRVDPQASNSVPYTRHYHRAFFCGHCGEVWGRLLIEGRPAEWISVQRDCRKCATKLDDLSGSFLDPHWWSSDLLITNPALPDAVVQWEFQGVVPFIEKELQNASGR